MSQELFLVLPALLWIHFVPLPPRPRNFADKFIFDTDGSVVARTKDIADTLAAFTPLLEPKASL